MPCGSIQDCASPCGSYAPVTIALKEIQQMPLREKLFVMEAIWNDLSRDEGDVEVLHWHKELLDEREQLVMEDKAVFTDWDDAKMQISEAVH